jgi:hypothetical protein
MIRLPDPAHEVPDNLKIKAGYYYFKSLNDDPAIKCQAVVSLIRTLRSIMYQGELLETEYFDEQFNFKTTLGKFLEYQALGANTGLNNYTSGKMGYAVEISNGVLNQLFFILDDERFVTEDKGTFIGVEHK